MSPEMVVLVGLGHPNLSPHAQGHLESPPINLANASEKHPFSPQHMHHCLEDKVD